MLGPAHLAVEIIASHARLCASDHSGVSSVQVDDAWGAAMGETLVKAYALVAVQAVKKRHWGCLAKCPTTHSPSELTLHWCHVPAKPPRAATARMISPESLTRSGRGD